MPKAHKQVIAAIADCHTEAAGSTLYVCEACGQRHVVHRSCGTRPCPCCPQGKGRAWRERHRARQLPGEHFMITFTVPEPLRPFLRRHQRIGYGALFAASAGAIKTLAVDPRHIGGDVPGFFGVLHTWGRTLQYHPHIHSVVVGGALSSEDGRWHPARPGFYLPVRALSRIVRAKFRAQIDKRGLLAEIPEEVWTKEWNVNCQPAGDGSAALQYLAPYVFKIAIGEHRILAVDAHDVRFRYQKPHSNRVRTMTLPIMEFLRRFLQHVLPRGVMKVRYYGFLSPSAAVPLADVRARIEMARVCAGGPRDHPRASGGPALPSLRGRPAVLPPAPARRRRDRLPRRAWPAAWRVVRPQRRAGRSLIRAAGPRRPPIATAPRAARRPGAPSLTRFRDAHGPARPRCARHHAPSTS